MRGLPVESLIVSAPMATRSKAAAEKRISIGDTLTAVFSHYKNGAKTLIPAAIIVFAIPVAAIIVGYILAEEVEGALGVILIVVGFIAAIVVSVLYHAGAVILVEQLEKKRKLMGPIELLKSASDRFWAVLGVIVVSILSLFVGFVVAAVYFSMALPATVLNKDRAALDNFGVSARLASGNAWRIFWTYFVLMVILNVVASVVLEAFGDTAGPILQGIFNLVVIAPIWAIFPPTLYFMCRGLGTRPKTT